MKVELYMTMKEVSEFYKNGGEGVFSYDEHGNKTLLDHLTFGEISVLLPDVSEVFDVFRIADITPVEFPYINCDEFADVVKTFGKVNAEKLGYDRKTLGTYTKTVTQDGEVSYTEVKNHVELAIAFEDNLPLVILRTEKF